MFTNVDLTTPFPTEPANVSYPLWELGDSTHLKIEQKYLVLKDYYIRGEKNSRVELDKLNLKDPFSFIGIENSYLVSESVPVSRGALYEFTRTYITTPQERQRYEAYSYTYPGINDENAYFDVGVSSQTLNYVPANGYYRLDLTCNGTPDVTVGSMIKVYFVGFWYGGVSSVWLEVVFKSGNVVGVISPYGDRRVVSNIEGAASVSLPKNKVTNSKIVYTYYNTLDESTIPIEQVFNITNQSTGADTDTITANTIPSLTNWRQDLIRAGAWICVEPTIITPYNGWSNIWEAQTRYVKAQ